METHTHSVAELNAQITDALRGAFPDQVWVQGEIRDWKVSARGHAYFTLIEPGTLGRPSEATLSVVLFAGNRRAVDHVLAKAGGLALTDGLAVRIRGEVLFYPPQGRIQLRMAAIDPRHTLGQMAADRDMLLRALAAEGLLDRNQRMPLEPIPLRIGLITSADSAAAHDLLEELSASTYGWQVSLIDTRVQGVDAVHQLVGALRVAAGLPVDVVAVVRGGGSRSDLVAFDHEAVARAIAAMPVPVVTGIGHEIDDSVADRVAHRSFKTPTACAAFLCDRVTTYLDRCDDRWRTLARRSTDLLDRHEARVRHAAGQVTAGARTTLELSAAHLVGLQAGMVREPDRALERADRHLDSLHRHVGALDPTRVLARGWSITRTADGRLVHTVDDVGPGEALRTRVADGIIHSTTEHVVSDPAPSSEPPADQTEMSSRDRP